MPWPCTTIACSVPSSCNTSAIKGAIEGSYTPTSCLLTLAGLSIGPRMLKNVRMPTSFLGPITFLIDLWNPGANMNPIPVPEIQSSTSVGPRSMGIPSAESTSADPELLEIARLPCLATGTPPAETTNDAAVLMLKVFAPSPPVPHRSTAFSGAETLSARSRMLSAKPRSSSLVSPFILTAVMKDAIWLGVAEPAIISSITSRAASLERSLWSTTD